MEGPAATSSSLRPATRDDLAEICRIETAVHVAPWTEQHFVDELQKPYSEFLVMTDDDTDTQVAGYIVYWLMFDECQILNVAVDLPYRGLGFAKLMIRRAVQAALKKEIRKVTLDVRRGNKAAIQLYQGLGFTITSVRKAFYSNGEDAYQMRLSLQDDGIEF